MCAPTKTAWSLKLCSEKLWNSDYICITLHYVTLHSLISKYHIDISRRKGLWTKDIGIKAVFISTTKLRWEMSWYVIDCADVSRTIINTLLLIATSIHVDVSYLNTFNWELEEHDIQQYNSICVYFYSAKQVTDKVHCTCNRMLAIFW